MGGGEMIHLGDITRIHGAGAPIVEVIIGGSPCQDLSVAGKRAGLAGERSGLFMDQVRIVKEMRDYDARVNARTGDDVRPRYMVWENVPGAFSSNGGEDFRAVLEEIARIVEKDAVIPGPPNGKWQTVGCIVGDGWSIAWRVLDAQFWGVPQRRRRIALVADFGGDTAPEILFERESVSGDSQTSGAQGQGTAGAVGGGSEGAIGVDLYNQTQTGEVSKTLNAAVTDADHVPCVAIGFKPGDHQNRVTDYTALTFQNTGHGWWNESPVGTTIRTPCGGDSTLANIVCAVDCRNDTENPDINGTLQAKSNGGMSLNMRNTVRAQSLVR
jgi:site-specific DNA-cytosine methylase